MKVRTTNYRNRERVLLVAESPADLRQIGLLVKLHNWELGASGEGCYIPHELTRQVDPINTELIALAISSTHAAVHGRSAVPVTVNRH